MSAAAEAASIPDQAAIERAQAFTRERFVHDGEEAAVALAPGSGRRRALEDALREIDAGATVPSTRWRRRYALLLGLERVLSEDEPRLADGALLNPHQVDALSGTLTALLAAVQNGHSLAPPAAEPVLAVDDEPEAPAAAAPARARGERDGGVFAVVNEALTRERFGALDGGLIGNRCGLNGRRHGISHDLAICAERESRRAAMPGDSEPPGWSGDDAREGLPWIQRPSP